MITTIYSEEEGKQYAANLARLATLPKTPLAPQSNQPEVFEQARREAVRRECAPLNGNRGFSLLH
jgi:hypothetical protein